MLEKILIEFFTRNYSINYTNEQYYSDLNEYTFYILNFLQLDINKTNYMIVQNILIKGDIMKLSYNINKLKNLVRKNKIKNL